MSKKIKIEGIAPTVLAAMICTFILYALALYNSQFVTAKELKPLEKSMIEYTIHLKHINDNLTDIKAEIKTLKESL